MLILHERVYVCISMYVVITVTEAEDGSDGGDKKNVEEREAASFHCGTKIK